MNHEMYLCYERIMTIDYFFKTSIVGQLTHQCEEIENATIQPNNIHSASPQILLANTRILRRRVVPHSRHMCEAHFKTYVTKQYLLKQKNKRHYGLVGRYIILCRFRWQWIRMSNTKLLVCLICVECVCVSNVSISLVGFFFSPKNNCSRLFCFWLEFICSLFSLNNVISNSTRVFIAIFMWPGHSSDISFCVWAFLRLPLETSMLSTFTVLDVAFHGQFGYGIFVRMPSILFIDFGRNSRIWSQ